MDRKLLVLAYNFPPWGGGASIRVRKFCKYLPRLGWEVHVVTIDRRYVDPAAPIDEASLADVASCRVYATRSLEPGTRLKGILRGAAGMTPDGAAAREPGPLGRSLRFLRAQVEPLVLRPDYTVLWTPRAVAEGRRLARREGIRVVYAAGPPYGALFTARRLARAAGMRLVLDVKDLWVGGPFHARQPALRRAWDVRAERSLLHAADRVLVTTPEALAEYETRYPDLADRLAFIPNGVDLEDFEESGPPAQRFRIVVPGFLDALRDPAPLVRAFARLSRRGALGAAELLFLGDVHPPHLDAARAMLGPRLIHIGTVPHREFARTLFSAAALVLIPSRGIETAVPGKLFEMAAAGRRTLVLAEEGATVRLCRRSGWGIVAPPTDEAGIERFLLDAFAAHARGETAIPRPEALLAEFSRERQATRFSAILDELLSD